MLINNTNADLIRVVEELKSARIIKKDIDIANKTGYSRGVISNYLSARIPASKNFLEKFEEVYNVSLKENNVSLNHKNEAHQVPFDDFMEVKYLPVRGHAGYLNAYGDRDGAADLDLDSMLVPKEFEKGSYLVVEVNGDSMDDGSNKAICDGDKLLAKELEADLWKFNKLHFKSNIFILFTKNDGIVVKQITKHSISSGELTCHSWNPLFKDFVVNVNDVFRLFYVKKIVERKIRF